MNDSITTSDGQSIACYFDGPKDAPVVVLSNSLGTEFRLWDFQVRVLTPHFRVLRYDSLGHGRSSVPAGDYALERLALDVVEIMDALGIQRAALCGISLGGMVGQWLGCYAPERLSALALCNTSAYLGPPQVWDARISVVRRRGLADVAEAVLQRWFTPGFLNASPEPVELARRMLRGTSSVGYAGCCAAIRDLDFRRSATITTPTLIVAGAYDLATPPAHAKALHAHIPGARLEILPGAHLCNLEVPDEFSETLLSFLMSKANRVAATPRIRGVVSPKTDR